LVTSVSSLSVYFATTTLPVSTTTTSLSVLGNIIIGGDSSFNSRLFVGSDTSLNGSLFVAKDMSLNGRLFASGDTSLNGNLFVGSISERCANVATASTIVLDLSKPYAIYYSTGLVTANFTVTLSGIQRSNYFSKVTGGLSQTNTISLVYYTSGGTNTFYGTAVTITPSVDISSTLFFNGGTPSLSTSSGRTYTPFIQTFSIINNPAIYNNITDLSRIIISTVNNYF
jgi:hypothetical protein